MSTNFLYLFKKNGYVLVINKQNLKWILGKKPLENLVLNLKKNYRHAEREKALMQYLTESEKEREKPWSLKTIKAIGLLPTLGCNLSCIHCFYGTSTTTANYWDDEVFDKVLSIFNYLPSLEEVTITGGEPFVYRKIYTLIETILENTRLKVCLMSNGTMLKFDEFERWAKKYPDRIHLQISLDGISNEIYKIMRKIDVEYALKSIHILRKLNFPVDISYTLNSFNQKDFFPILRFIIDNSLTLHIPYLEKTGNAKINVLDHPENFIDLMSFLIYYKFNINPNIKISFIDGIIKGIESNVLSTHCGAAFNQFAIFPNGEINPCTEIYFKDFEIANIKNINSTKDLERFITESQHKKGFSKNISDSFCKDCAFSYICAGECRSESILERRDFLVEQKKDRCNFSKRIYELIFWEYSFSQMESDKPNTKFLYSPSVLNYEKELSSIALSSP